MSNTPRVSALPGDHTVPEVAVDDCFPTKGGSDTTLTVLVIKDRDSRAILAHLVPSKGRLHEDTVDQA
eukprot:8543689-Alexandrium_andersonii.AAC.1